MHSLVTSREEADAVKWNFSFWLFLLYSAGCFFGIHYLGRVGRVDALKVAERRVNGNVEEIRGVFADDERKCCCERWKYRPVQAMAGSRAACRGRCHRCYMSVVPAPRPSWSSWAAWSTFSNLHEEVDGAKLEHFKKETWPRRPVSDATLLVCASQRLLGPWRVLGAIRTSGA